MFNCNSTRNLEILIRDALNKYLKADAGSDEKTDLLTILRNLIFFIAIYSYFIGWTYTYYLYSHFGVSLYSLEIPFYYFFIYSYSVVFNNICWFVFIISSFLIITFISRKKKNLQKLIIALFLILFFPVSFNLAKITAFNSALLLRQGYGQTIRLVFKETFKEIQKSAPVKSTDTENQSGSKNYPDEFLNANKSGELRLLTQTKDKFFVLFQPPREEDGSELPYCFAYVIASTEVSLFTIEVQNVPDTDVQIMDIPR